MIRGADAPFVRRAIRTGNPLPGGPGFAGRLPDGRLVRDPLGREPLFIEESVQAEDGETSPAARPWSIDPTELESPVPFPPGAVGSLDEPRRRWSLPDPPPLGETTATHRVHRELESAIDAIDGEDLAIAFSGGVDSALIAAMLDAPLYTVGFPDSHDVEQARDVAALLGRELAVRELTVDELDVAVPAVARAIDRTNAMDVQIALTLHFVAERAAADGYERLALGVGADEVFGGYAKIASPDHRVAAETVRRARWEVLSAIPAGAARDVLAVRSAGVEPVRPYLTDGVISAALGLPESLIVAGDTRKVALRRFAETRMPATVARRDKKAMQYGSLVSRELDRLARQAGFKRRIGDHVTKYVADRVESA